MQHNQSHHGNMIQWIVEGHEFSHNILFSIEFADLRFNLKIILRVRVCSKKHLSSKLKSLELFRRTTSSSIEWKSFRNYFKKLLKFGIFQRVMKFFNEKLRGFKAIWAVSRALHWSLKVSQMYYETIHVSVIHLRIS